MKPILIWLWENAVWRPRPVRLTCSDCKHWRQSGFRVTCAASGRSVSRERRTLGWWRAWRGGECGDLGVWHTTWSGYNLERERVSAGAYWLAFAGLALFWFEPWWMLALAIDVQIALWAVLVWAHPLLHRGDVVGLLAAWRNR